MYCVSCGAADQAEQAYCRRCGKWPGGTGPDQRMKVTLIFSAVNAVLAATSAIVLYATYLGTRAGTPAVYLAATFSCVISVHQTISFLFQLEQLRRLKRGRSAGQPSSATQEDQITGRPRTPAALRSVDTSEFIPASSVVERTTELLDPVPRAVKRDQ